MDGMVVVVADDDAMVRALVAAELRAALDAEVVGAADGDHALRVLRHVHPSLFVFDAELPVIDGLGLLRRIGDDPLLTRVPTIAIGAAAQAGALVAAGVSAYLARPLAMPELVLAARRLVGLVSRDGSDSR